jgi:hypothetical protein
MGIIMKKFFKKSVLFVAVIGTFFTVLPMGVLATSSAAAPPAQGAATRYIGSIHRTSAGLSFSSSWQSTAYDTNNGASLTYGYNTAFFNEDYAWATHTQRQHSAEVRNDNGAFGSGRVFAGETAKIEVIHAGTNIQYQCTW